MAVSFVGSNALADALGEDGAGVYVTQVVPLPQDGSIPVVARYHRALTGYEPQAEPGFVSLEGYMAGRSGRRRSRSLRPGAQPRLLPPVVTQR